jgi:hypothetical protein
MSINEGFNNDFNNDFQAYQNDNDVDDNEIIILFLGWKRSGKTTIKEVCVFNILEIPTSSFSI